MAPDFRPLAGCRVVDLSMLLPGPYCTWQLASFGAEVIKVEPPTGDPLRKLGPDMFTLLNRGKQSVVLDLKQASDRQALLDLVASADMLVEGFRPGTLDRLGLALDTLRQAHPRLIVGSLSSFGWTGPERDHAGHDIGFLSLAGYFAVPAQLDAEPTRPQVRLADLAAGQSAALALTMAWVNVQRTGLGCHVDASLFDATLAWTAPMMLSTAPGQAAVDQPQVMADSAIYRTADGRHLCVATLEDKFWTNFVAAVQDLAPALADPRWQTRKGRDQHKRALADALIQAIAAHPLATWLERVKGVDTTIAPVRLGREALADPQVLARGLVHAQAADGQPEVLFPALFDGGRLASSTPAPALGQATAADFLQRRA